MRKSRLVSCSPVLLSSVMIFRKRDVTVTIAQAMVRIGERRAGPAPMHKKEQYRVTIVPCRLGM